MRKRLLATLFLLSVFLLTGCGTEKLDLTEFYHLNLEGLNGFGRAEIELDQEKLEKSDAFSSADAKEKEKLERFAKSVSFTVEPDKKLKDGDKLLITPSYDKEAANEANLIVGAEQTEYDIPVGTFQRGVHIGEKDLRDAYEVIAKKLDDENVEVTVETRGDAEFLELVDASLLEVDLENLRATVSFELMKDPRMESQDDTFILDVDQLDFSLDESIND